MTARVAPSLAKRRRSFLLTQGAEECLIALAIAAKMTEDEVIDALLRKGELGQVYAGRRERMLIAGGEFPETP